MAKTIINGLFQGTILHGKSYDYEIVKALGQGSFGITYLASVKMRGELGSIDATVYIAIKEFFMHEVNGRDGATVTSGNKAEFFEKYKIKFIKEAINLSKLHHDNIIHVFEVFEANNTVYYTMEYVAGASLDELIKKHNRILEDEALKYAKQIGNAVNFMHCHNMLHLDLKPSNIMLHNGKAIVIDFGLSQLYTEEPRIPIGITEGYAPLEQGNYNGTKVNNLPISIDVYAFGATMFKMLTGHKPPVASDILNEGFPSDGLSAKGVSQRLIEIISKSMEPLPKNRFQSMEEVLKQIELFHGNVMQDYTSNDKDTEKTLLDNKHHEPFDLGSFFENIKSQYIGLDYHDYLTFLHIDGEKHSFMGCAECKDRIENALGNAIASGEGVEIINRASNVIITIIRSSKAESPLTVKEVQYLNEFIKGFSENCAVSWGLAEDPALGNAVKVIILANVNK